MKNRKKRENKGKRQEGGREQRIYCGHGEIGRVNRERGGERR